ncbi:MAG: cyclase family protein [Thermodesulfobacteriota bacterium]
MTLHDVTLTLEEGMLTFPGDPPFEIGSVLLVDEGDKFNISRICLGSHTGTHVDPPSHYLPGGTTVDEIPLEVLVGPGVVLDMRGKRFIDRQALDACDLTGYARVLLKTDNGPRLLDKTFRKDYVHLTEDGARCLVERGVLLVGIDYLSIEKYENSGAPVHHILLSAGILVVEGLNLLDVPSGPCEVYCLPLKVRNGDGAPARVLVRV